MTVTMSIREVARHTSTAIHRAAAGETVLITEHDEPIAMLVPPPDTGDPEVDRLIRDAVLTPAGNRGGVAALLAIEPVRTRDDADSAEVVSELREDHA